MMKLVVCPTMHIFIIWCIQISTCENLNQNSKNKMDKITCNYREVEFGRGRYLDRLNGRSILSAIFCLPAKKTHTTNDKSTLIHDILTQYQNHFLELTSTLIFGFGFSEIEASFADLTSNRFLMIISLGSPCIF